ncbi:MAG TPA: hypothetical protein VFC23_02740, partial [Thermoanaerobaculia bacterium]|nr:hypothetical protein [Thermoanaerobaculia bacterium]
MRLALGLALLFSMAAMAATVGDPPVPFPDLKPLEKEVAEQLAAAQQRLTALAAAAAPSPQDLATAYGELG